MRNSSTATIKSSGKDRYGRTLGYILFEDQAINTMMVRMGMAWWYRRYDKTEELENAERYAKENGKALIRFGSGVLMFTVRCLRILLQHYPLAAEGAAF